MFHLFFYSHYIVTENQSWLGLRIEMITCNRNKWGTPIDTYQETGDPARLPAQLAERWGPKNIFYWEQKSLVPAQQAQRINQERTHYICTLWISLHLSFNSRQGPSLVSLGNPLLPSSELAERRRRFLHLIPVFFSLSPTENLKSE